LIHNILRSRIYESAWWKEHCFALSAETLVDQAMKLEYYGGAYGNIRKPSPFLCLLLKMLQIQPDKEIIIELIKNEDFKYVRALGAFYLRLVGKNVDIYNYLEPLYNDMRKIRFRDEFGKYSIIHMDQLVEELLTKDFVNDVTLPYLAKRSSLENSGAMQLRVSQLADDEDELDDIMAEVEKEDERLEKQLVTEAKEKAKAKEALKSGIKPEIDPADEGKEKEEAKEEKPKEEKKEKTKKKKPTRDEDSDEESSRRARGRDRSRSRSRGRGGRDRRSRSRDYERRKRERSRSRSRDRRRDERRRSYSRSNSPRDRREKKDKKDSKKKRKDDDAGDKGGGSKDNLSVQDTNKLRAELGLKPLKA